MRSQAQTILSLLFILVTNCLVGNGLPGFLQNKGQVADQNFKQRTDVLFSGSAKGLVAHFRAEGLLYQVGQALSYTTITTAKTGKQIEVPAVMSISRVEMTWLNCLKPTIEPRSELQDYYNFYLPQCPEGVLQARRFEKLLYRGLYKGIDALYYYKEGQLKCDYLLAAGSDFRDIRISVKGAKKIIENQDGSLTIVTAHGNITEGAPVVLQDGRAPKARWRIKGNTLSFVITDFDPSRPMVIDPITRAWGTYYGDDDIEYANSSVIDRSQDLLIGGWVSAGLTMQLATTGAFQTTITGSTDGFLAKFDNAGNRLWATYYGDFFNDGVNCIATDAIGQYLVTGGTARYTSAISTVLATSGAFQSSNKGGTDAFVARFNSSGARIWGTYFGGTDTDSGHGCTFDTFGNFYICGGTYSDSLGTSGTHQQLYNGWWFGPSGGKYGSDAFIAKFSPTGSRLWTTYFGGSVDEEAFACSADPNGDLFVVGSTCSMNDTAKIATTGAFQTNISNKQFWLNRSGFILKLSANGTRSWSTYFGKSKYEQVLLDVKCDPNGNAWMAGFSDRDTLIATAGAWQQGHGGWRDAVLAKFNSTGQRVYCTLLGGAGSESAQSVFQMGANVYLAGEGLSGSGYIIADSISHQPVAHGQDAFVVKFDTSGTRHWGTYYGGFNWEEGVSVVADATGAIYLTGSTSSGGAGTAVASLNSFQPAIGGVVDAFVAKLFECNSLAAPANVTADTNLLFCEFRSTILKTVANGPVSWFATQTSTVPLAIGYTYTTSVLAAGIYTLFAETQGCSQIGRSAIVFTVGATPTVVVSSASVCSGKMFTTAVSGAYEYSLDKTPFWFYTSIGGTYSTSLTHTIVGRSQIGCMSPPVYCTITVMPLPQLTVTSSADSVCIGKSATLTAYGASSYTWLPNTTQQHLIISPNVGSFFYVKGASSFGCVSQKNFYQPVKLCDTTGGGGTGTATAVSDISIYETTIFPNPAVDFLEAQTEHQSRFTIVTALGIVVQEGELRAGQNHIPINLHEGCYLMIVSDQSGQHTRKFLVEH